MGWFGPQSGSCGCCGPEFVCDDCAALTTFAISGLANAACTSGCNGRNGTYVFRTAGTYITNGDICGWRVNWGNDNCGTPDGYYIGTYPSVGGFPAHCEDAIYGVIISFRYVAGLVEITVDIHMPYTDRDAFGQPIDQSGYVATYRSEFGSCADAVGQTLPLVSSSFTDCAVGGTGDVCNITGATITLG